MSTTTRRIRARKAGLATEFEFPSNENLLRMLLDSMQDSAIFLLNNDGQIVNASQGSKRTLGYDQLELVGRHFSMFYTPIEVARGWPEHELGMATRDGRFEQEGWRLRKDGTRLWSHNVITALRGSDGTLHGYSKITRDYTEQKRSQEERRRIEERARVLQDQAMKDALTGAYNRRCMVERLGEAVERHDAAASLLMIDIDRFKSINDRLGHEAGDFVLVGVAALATRLSRECDVLFRQGGDEFALFLNGATEAETRGIAERIRAAVEAPGLLKNGQVTVSIGVAELQPGETVESWIQRADSALYEAKRGGRNRVCFKLAA